MGHADQGHRGRSASRWHPAEGLVRAELDVSGLTRSYWLAAAPEQEAPLVVAVHGLGTSGKDMASFTGLAQRGPAAGFAVVFPDAIGEIWDGERGLPGREGVDDAGFINALLDKLVDDRTARRGALFLVGLSNGALFVEHLARHGLVAPTGIMLVAGTARLKSRREVPQPRVKCAVLSVQGTADPVMPFEGGRPGGKGIIGWLVKRRLQVAGGGGEDRSVVSAEEVARDWARANELPPEPRFEPFPSSERGVHVARRTWSAPGQPPVVLYMLEGGGHGWPGGPQYLPAWLIGRVSRDFDATKSFLEVARQLA
ncbi:MAG TPA: hypothetical protein VME20_05650 [Acidimicrobiales bacterium]|nr:hypothetical protein [Acidimicrobiales bacterium]